MVRPWDWPDPEGPADHGVGHRHPGVSLGWRISLLHPFFHELSVQRREVERSKGERRREMHMERDVCMRMARQEALGNVS